MRHKQAILSATARRRRRAALFLALLLCCGTGTRAALQWERTEAVVPLPSPDAVSVTGTFPFRNAGDQPVRVLAARSGCPCVLAATDKGEYAPGERGMLTVRLQAQRGVGRVEKTVHVLTDDPAQPATAVRLACTAPAWLSAEPGWLVWRQGEAPEARSVRLTADVPGPVHVRAIRTEPTGFRHELLTHVAGREYELRVTPDTVGERLRQSFTLVVEYAPDRTFEFSLDAVVLPALKHPPPPGWQARAWALVGSDRAWNVVLAALVAGLAVLAWGLLRRLGRKPPRIR